MNNTDSSLNIHQPWREFQSGGSGDNAADALFKLLFIGKGSGGFEAYNLCAWGHIGGDGINQTSCGWERRLQPQPNTSMGCLYT